MTSLALLLAMALDAAFGEPDWLWTRVAHPARLAGRAVATLESWTRKLLPSSPFAAGIAMISILALCALVLGVAISWIGWLAEALVAAVLLAHRSLVQHVSAVADALRLSLHDGRLVVSRIVGRDTADMTEDEVGRAAIESAAENLSDGVVAPAFWFLIAGLPGLLVYKAVNTADSMVGYRNSRYEEFGRATARLDDLLNLVPARLTAFVLAAVTNRLWEWPSISRDARLHNSPNAGWPEAAMASALGVSLAGPRSYDGEKREFAWVNAIGSDKAGPPEIDAAVSLLWRAWWACFGAVAIIALMALF